jgi:tetratricopeptide (TPR) repeat protein
MKLINISFIIIAIITITTSCHHGTVATQSTTPTISATNSIEYKDANGNINLLGKTSRQRMTQAPFDTWFNKNYADYTIDSNTANQLKPLVKNKQFIIFMGTWCGDSRREVPRMYKLLEYCGVKPSQIQLVNVDNRDSVYKQSPGHEERGLYISRVPDLLVYDNNKEKGRIVESPVFSLEKDLLAIVDNKTYAPHYPGTAYLAGLFQSPQWMPTKETLEQTAEQLRSLIPQWGELASFARVLLAGGETDKAIDALRINILLYPSEVGAFNYLAGAYVKKGNTAGAKECCQKVLQLQPGNQQAIAMLDQLNKQ